MSVSIDIHPMADSLDMYGEYDASSAYSLSGHVSISLTSPYSLFEHRRPARFLLQSLSLTFEGQSELISPTIGYAATRLCTISREIGPCEPVELTNDGLEDSDEPCSWNVVFNIPIPGWLPATCSIGSQYDVGTRYILYATAKFVNMDDNSGAPWSFSALCSSFRSKTKLVDAETDIIIRRFIDPPASSTFPCANYLVNTTKTPKPSSSPLSIPSDVLSKIQILASIPEYVDMDESSIPLTIRLRPQGLDGIHCERLQVTGFTVDVTQMEMYRHSPSSEYRSRFPIPDEASQPPNEPLRRPHPMSTIYELGLYTPPSMYENFTNRAVSLLPNGENGEFTFAGDNYIFSTNTGPSPPKTWYTMDTTVPFGQIGKLDEREWAWAGPSKLRPSTFTPHFTVGHELKITLICTYDMPNSEEKASEKLGFSIPIHFMPLTPVQPVHMEPPLPSPSSYSVETPLLTNIKPSLPYAQTLPPYSQLFDSNGDRKIDYSIPLPLYSPAGTSSPSLPQEFDAPYEEKEANVYPNLS